MSYLYRVKNAASILLCITLSLLWICGGAGVSAGDYAHTTVHIIPEGINPSSEQTIAALQQSTSLFELPAQVRVPATRPVSQVVRLVPELQYETSDFTNIRISKPIVPPGQQSGIFPSTGRSVDRYVYSLRKIVI